VLNILLDTKKMPLGKISKAQIAKGFEALEKIDAKIKDISSAGSYAELSSLFYTVIPHNFGRQRPPIIGDAESLQKKMDMLTVRAVDCALSVNIFVCLDICVPVFCSIGINDINSQALT